jgi:Fe-S-cluster containining protein
MRNPCLDCGACCAHFRVSFYWNEADPAAGGATPTELTEQLTAHYAVMRGTNRRPRRCIALQGEVGKQVLCAIHASRPSPCRVFQASWSDGVHNEHCDRARAAYGLAPLEPPPFETLALLAGVVTSNSGANSRDSGHRPQADLPGTVPTEPKEGS